MFTRLTGANPLKPLAGAFISRFRSGWAYGWIFIGSVLESTILPIPFEVVFVPLLLAFPAHTWRIATVALAGCVTAAIIGYVTGALVYEQVGPRVMGWLGQAGALEAFAGRLEAEGFWAIATVSLSPVPMQVAALTAGFADYPFVSFLGAILVGRVPRYHGLALLTLWLGPAIMVLTRRYRKSATVVGAVLSAVILAMLFL